MTANCPRCGGKFDEERRDFTIDIPEGYRVEINCLYCKTTLEYNLSLEQTKEFCLEEVARFYNMIERLEEETRKEVTRELESITIEEMFKRKITERS